MKVPKLFKPKEPDITSNIYLSQAWQLSSTVIATTLIGWWIDNTWNTSPRYIVILSITGIVTGLYSFIKTVIDEDKRNKKRKEEKINQNKIEE